MKPNNFNDKQEHSEHLPDRDFLRNKRKLLHNNNISPLSNPDEDKNKFYHNQFYNTAQSNQGYNYNYANNDKVTQQIYIINNYNLSGNSSIQNEKKPCVNNLSLEKKNVKSESESPSNIYSKVVEEKTENRNIFKTRPKFSTRFQHYYKSISSSKSDNNNSKYHHKKSYKKSKMRNNRKSGSSSLSSSKSRSIISRSKSRDEIKVEEGLLKKNNEDYLDKNSSKSKSNKKKHKRLKKSRSHSKDSRESVFSAKPRIKFQNKIHNNIPRMNQDNNYNKTRFGYKNFNFNNNNLFHHRDNNRVKNFYEKDFYHNNNKFKNNNKFRNHYYFERKNNNNYNNSNYSNRFNKSGFYFNKYYEKRDYNKEFRKSCVSEKSNSPSNMRKSDDCDSIRSVKKSKIGHNDSTNDLIFDEKERLLTEYIKLKKKLSRNSPSSENNSESDTNILNCPISIRSSLKNPYKI